MDGKFDRLHSCLRTYKYECDRQASTSNLLISPLCMETALLMAYVGSRGKTQREISDLLGTNTLCALESLSYRLKQLENGEVEELKEPITLWVNGGYFTYYDDPIEYYKLVMCNAVLIHDGLSVNASYVNELQRLFNESCIPVPFATDTDDAVRRINEVLQQRTKGILCNVISTTDVTADTKLMLVNALCFKSTWHHQFKDIYTVKKPFTTTAGVEVLVNTMHVTAKCNYGKSKELDGAEFLQMPFIEHSSSVFFILPGKRDTADQGLNTLRNVLTASNLSQAIQTMYPVYYVSVQMPKFHLERSLDMEETLREVGVSAMFQPQEADLSGVTEEFPVHISKIKQHLDLDVNERGTDAAAPSLDFNYFGPWGGPEADTTADFIMDHPFMFFVRHDKTDTILFMGHVSDPTLA